MHSSRQWFKRVVWLGILANWTFAFWALFVNPYQILTTLGLGEVNSTVWIFNYSILLVFISCYFIPAANDPLRYRANAWLLVIGRLIPASSYFIGVYLGFMPRGFLTEGLADGTFGIVQLFLLRKVLREAGA
jgi:hypothetical protein